MLEDEITIPEPKIIVVEDAKLPKASSVSDSFAAVEEGIVIPESEAAVFEDGVSATRLSGDSVEYRSTTLIDDDNVVLRVTEIVPTEEEACEPVVISDGEGEKVEDSTKAKPTAKISTIPTTTSGQIKREDPMIPTLPPVNANGNGNSPETPFVLPATQQGRDMMATYADLRSEESDSAYAEAMRETYDIPVAPMIDRNSDSSETPAESDSESKEVVVERAPVEARRSESETIVADADVEILFAGDEEDEDEPITSEPIVEESVEDDVSTEEEISEEEPVEEDSAEESVEEETTEEEPVGEDSAEESTEETIEEESTEESEEESVEAPIVEEPVVEESEDESTEDEPAVVVVEETVEEESIEDTDGLVHTDAEHADELMTDEEAEEHIEVIEETADRERTGKVHAINLDTICEHFEDGETVTLEALKEKRLAPQNAGRVKILARGIMTKRLDIIADNFSLQAVKMITLAGGRAEQFK